MNVLQDEMIQARVKRVQTNIHHGSTEIPTPSTETWLKQTLESVQKEIQDVAGPIDTLAPAVGYYVNIPGKRIRPTVSLLISQAIFEHYCITRQGVANQEDRNSLRVLRSKTVAAALESVHLASLMHDDVVDDATLRRGSSSINLKFGNKYAILGGDFLFAHASVLISQLESPTILKLFSQIIKDLVNGEVVQAQTLNQSWEKVLESFDLSVCMETYIKKSYLKTGALFANGAAISARMLQEVYDIADGEDGINQANFFEFGRNLGTAFQIIDDLLDYSESSDITGKDTGLDDNMSNAPLLYAIEENPQIGEALINNEPLEKIREMVINTKGVQRSRALARDYVTKALDCLKCLSDSPFKQSLVQIAENSLNRKK